MNQTKIETFAGADDLSKRAAAIFVEAARNAINARGVFSVALSGGSTPRKLYELLSDANQPFCAQIAWQKAHFFFGDERHVLPGDKDSNFKMANEALFARVAELPEENVHRVLTETDAADAANLYEDELRRFFQSETVEFPRFDLILLGLGADGHTASLFPNTAALDENARFFVENFVEKFGAYRLTLTFPVINNARRVLFLASGAEKARVLREILQPETREIKFPAQRVNLVDGDLLWLIDEAAASNLA